MKLPVSLPGIFILMVFCFYSPATKGQLFLSPGASEAAMSGSSIVSTGFWSCFNNPAAAAYYRYPSAGFSLESRFGIPELTTRTAAVILPTGGTAAGIRIIQYGFAGFSNTTVSLSAGVRIWETLSAGATIYLVTEREPESGTIMAVPVAETGIIVDLPDGPRLGILLFNPATGFPETNTLPYIIKTGIGHLFADDFFISALVEKSRGHDLSFSMGLEYLIDDRVPLRLGYRSSPAGFSVGTGYTHNRITADCSFASHPMLGITPSLSLIWKFGDKK